MAFDEPDLVANAGMILVATLVRLGLEAGRHHGPFDGERRGPPGRKVLTLVHAMVAGASHIDHADVLRSGATRGARAPGDGPVHAGHVPARLHFRPCPPVRSRARRSLRRAWAWAPGRGATAGRRRRLDDLEVSGRAKAGAAYGYTKVLGYHPILATRADTGEVLHARMRKGSANTRGGRKRFVEELVARVRRAGAAGEMVTRFDSGFWSNATIATLGRLGVRYTMAVRCQLPSPRP